MTYDHIAFQVKPDFVDLPWNALTRDNIIWLRFVVHTSGRLHTMVLHGQGVDGGN